MNSEVKNTIPGNITSKFKIQDSLLDITRDV